MKEIKSELVRLLPACFLIVDARSTRFEIVEATDAYLAAVKRSREIIGRPIFEVFPHSEENRNEGLRQLKASFEKIIATKESHEWDIQRYDTSPGDGQPFEVRFWQPSNVPALGKQGKVNYIIHSVVDVAIQTILRNRLRSKDKKMKQQIADAISAIQEIERMEIGRDLHDNINQLLITSRLYLGRAINKTPVSVSFAETAYELLENAIEEVKNISTALSSSSFQKESLVSSLEHLIASIASDGSHNVEKYFALPDESLIEAKVKVGVFRIVQEQFSNIIKHADARQVIIRLSFSENLLHLMIQDDGKGFRPEE